MKIAVISPHLDDAVFSVAEHMLSRPDDQFCIVTPCGGIDGPDDAYRAKYLRLHREHRDVLMATGWGATDGAFLDDAAGPDGLRNVQSWLEHVLQEGGRDLFDEWWVPFGIHHPDHIAVHAACARIGRPSARYVLYEELPYRVLYPPMILPPIALQGEMDGYDPSMLERKRELCRLYVSQIGPEVERCLYVPERLWRSR